MRSPRRTRARSEDAQAELRARILENGRRLFLDKGFDAVSLRAIASSVGLTPAALYTYFPSKLALLRAIWTTDLEELHARVRDCGAPTDLRRQLHVVVAHWLARPDVFRVLFLIPDREPENGRGKAEMTVRSLPARSLIRLLQRSVAARLPGVSRTRRQREFEAMLSAVQGILAFAILVPEYGWSSPAKLLDIQIDAFEARWHGLADGHSPT